MEQTLPPASGPLADTYDSLVRDYRAAFVRLARRMTGNAEDAEDLLQETLLDAYRSFQQYRGGTHFYSWVARIMTNNHLDRVRRKQHPTISLERAGAEEDSEPLELPDETANPERALLCEMFDQRLQNALDSLQPVQRTTVMLCDLEGATYEEAAAYQRCPIGTIRSRLHRAHAALQAALGSAARREEPSATKRHSRRDFLRIGTAAAAGAALAGLRPAEAAAEAHDTRNVLVWSAGEAGSDACPQGPTVAIAEGLRLPGELRVRTASSREPDGGLSDASLQEADVLVWWGSPQPGGLSEERCAAVARLVREGRLGLIVTHSAGDCRPLELLLGGRCAWEREETDSAEPVQLRVTAPRHPIAQGVEPFTLERGACCRGRLAGPRPDIVVFEASTLDGGPAAWQGMVWKVGKGRVFYFAPGHEMTPVYGHEQVQRVFRNAVAWCAEGSGSAPVDAV